MYTPTYLISRNITAQMLNQPETANHKMNIGLFYQEMNSLPQLNILQTIKHETSPKMSLSQLDYDKTNIGRGTNTITNTSNFYMGEAYIGVDNGF